MRTGVCIVVSTILSMVHSTCSPSAQIMTMTGESATISFRNGEVHDVELLAVEDTSILCLMPEIPLRSGGFPGGSRVQEFPANSISEIRVSGIRNDRWYVGVLAFQVLPAVGLTVAAGSVDADAGAVFGVSMIPAVLTTLFYLGSGVPTPTFQDPISNVDLVQLRAYARFAGKLTPDQKDELQRAYGKR